MEGLGLIAHRVECIDCAKTIRLQVFENEQHAVNFDFQHARKNVFMRLNQSAIAWLELRGFANHPYQSVNSDERVVEGVNDVVPAGRQLLDAAHQFMEIGMWALVRQAMDLREARKDDIKGTS